MPKKPAEPGTIQMRLNAHLWDRMKSLGAKKGHSPRQEVELRLSHTLAGSGELRGLSWGGAMGRLVAMLADESFAYSTTVDEALIKLQIAMQALCSSLAEPVSDALGAGSKAKLNDTQQAWARSQGTWFAGKVLWAEKTRTKENGEEDDRSRDKEFRMLQEALLLSPRCLEALATTKPAKQGTRS